MAFRGNVQIDTHQLSAKTNLLEAWFRYPAVVATRNKVSEIDSSELLLYGSYTFVP